MQQMVAGDFNGDLTDLVTIWGDGTLHHNGHGDLNSSTQLTSASWGNMKILAAGDYTGDGIADILAEWGDGTSTSTTEQEASTPAPR
ncbi:FG-GAP repeat domain-containing protein [Streptomyces tropicalis]|uniref:VCBS repeat-containing protein n=1 Tax=Streptomyces tropicalis TaxID=3034234 RepID=A0ABT6A645_9ACTN|nr:VCBS repeat-containing protein [Streptomyces tropicalis]MDF3300122.1 VCBS repeat-containing protein [Streptomyces tropicalis]